MNAVEDSRVHFSAYPKSSILLESRGNWPIARAKKEDMNEAGS